MSDKFKLPKLKGKKVFHQGSDSNFLKIPFGNYFEFGGAYEQFRILLNTKRTYKRSSASIIDDNNHVLNHSFTSKVVNVETGETIVKNYNKKDGISVSDAFIYEYLSVKMSLDDDSDLVKMPYKFFISTVTNIITDDLVEVIKDFIDKHYEGCMDDTINSNSHKFDETTTFRDAHIKQICLVKYVGNLLIPICTHYCNIRTNVESKDFFHDLYVEIFKYLGLEAISSKLHRYTSMLVSNAYNTHKPIYERMSINGNTKDSNIEDVYSKILTTIITKIDPIDTVPAFIANAIKNSSSKYKPREDDGWNSSQGFSDEYVGGGGDNSIVTETERVDSRIARPDEALKAIRSGFCSDTVNKIESRYGVNLESFDELVFTEEHIELEGVQTDIISDIFSAIYGGGDNILDNNHLDYSRLQLLACKYLRKGGHFLMADFVGGKIVANAMGNRWGGKSSDKKLYGDPKYEVIMNTKYKFVRSEIEANNVIRNMVVKLANSIYHYNSYYDTKTLTVAERKDIKDNRSDRELIAAGETKVVENRFGSKIMVGDEEIITAVLDYFLEVIV